MEGDDKNDGSSSDDGGLSILITGYLLHSAYMEIQQCEAATRL